MRICREVNIGPFFCYPKMPGHFDDWLICAITSQIRHEIKDRDEKIGRADDDFKSSGLKAQSLIRIGKLATVEEEVLEGVLGEVSSGRLMRVLKRISTHLEREFTGHEL